MRSKRAVWLTLGACAAIVIGAWLLATASSESPELRVDSSSAAPPRKASDEAASARLPVSSTNRHAASTSSESPPRIAEPSTRARQLEQAIRDASHLSARIPPHGNLRDFDDVDMSPLRRLVRELDVQAHELESLLASTAEDDAQRPVVLAAFAYVDTVTEAERALILRASLGVDPMDVVDRGNAPSRTQPVSAFAGLFALQMLGADEQLESAALMLIEVPRDPMTTAGEQLRDLTMFALAGLDRVSAPELLSSVRGVTEAPPTGLLTSSAWKALGRMGSASDRARLLERAEARDGHAREGLEATTDPSMSNRLEQLASAGDRSVFAAYLAASSARGLLSIDSADSLGAFERVCLSPDAHARLTAERALALDPPPTAVAGLLRVSARARAIESDHPMGPAADEAVESIVARLQRATVPQRDVERSLRAVRDVLPEIGGDARALRSALEIIALCGDDAERSTLERYMGRISDEDRAAVREAWTRSHPTSALR